MYTSIMHNRVGLLNINVKLRLLNISHRTNQTGHSNKKRYMAASMTATASPTSGANSLLDPCKYCLAFPASSLPSPHCALRSSKHAVLAFRHALYAHTACDSQGTGSLKLAL